MASSTGSTPAHFGKMVWPVAGTAHLSKRVKFGALLNVTSSVLFTTLQHLFRFRYGSFGLLLRCFGGALDFFLRV